MNIKIRFILASVWIIFSEFLRNEILFRNIWIEKYSALGLEFKTLPINGIMWILWSFIFAYIILILIQKIEFYKAIFISWLAGFVLMWITIFNLQVLPTNLLLFAIPLSILEIYIAALILQENNKELIIIRKKLKI